MTLSREQILDYSVKYASGQTKYQNEVFVGHSHVTKYRQVRQALLELENRVHGMKKIEFELEREKVRQAHIQHLLDQCDNEFDRELLLIDAKDKQLDIEISERKLAMSQKETDVFIKQVQEACKDEEDLMRYWNDDEDEERKYWIARMGKQAALDMMSFGRISVGNLDSISMMPEEDQLQALTIGFQYSNLLGGQLAKLEKALQPATNKLLRDPNNFKLPTWDGIEDTLNIPLHQLLAGEPSKTHSLIEGVKQEKESQE